MQKYGGKIVLSVLICATLASCGRGGSPRLLNITANKGTPDEFAILPNKPLQQPESFAALPTPTPGGANLVDPTPDADAIAALGGRPGAVSRGIPANDGTLVNHANRFGVAGGIRQMLASEDLEFRKRNRGRVLERLFNVTVYFRAYRRMSLDKYAELERFRRLGVRTPAAPPE